MIIQRTRRRFCANGGLLAAMLPLGSATLIEACSAATSGRRVVLHTRIERDASAGSSFTTALGWTVSLDLALLASGPYHYYDGAPPSVSQPRSRDWRFALRSLALGTAHAHPGHYKFGNAVGEMLEPASVDLLGEPVTLADGAGVTGTYRSARFTLAPSTDPTSALGGQLALVEGRAEKAGAEPRFFRASAELADLTNSVVNGQVDGCEFAMGEVENDGTVTVQVKVQAWFNLVDFAELEPGSARAPGDFPADSQPKLAFSQGLAQLSAYRFSYVAKSAGVR
jgi:hypothetical protein